MHPDNDDADIRRRQEQVREVMAELALLEQARSRVPSWSGEYFDLTILIVEWLSRLRQAQAAQYDLIARRQHRFSQRREAQQKQIHDRPPTGSATDGETPSTV